MLAQFHFKPGALRESLRVSFALEFALDHCAARLCRRAAAEICRSATIFSPRSHSWHQWAFRRASQDEMKTVCCQPCSSSES